MNKINKNDKIMMETMYWWGIPTFFRCKNDENINNCDIGLVGVPHSTGNGTTERDQHLGPRAVRNISAGLRRVHVSFNFDPWNSVKINDLGDVMLPEANDNEKCIKRIIEYYEKISKSGKKVVSMGGDHSITGGIVKGLANKKSKLTKGKKINLIQFDAHTDTYENLGHFMGAKKSAAHWASYLVREGYVDAKHSSQIGIRGNPRTLNWLKPSYNLGYQVITMEDFRKIGINKCIKKIIKNLDDKPVYITFDLDCLDPSVAPAVANIEPASRGFNIEEVITLLQSLKGKVKILLEET